jgi:hypothetical protein
VEREQVDVAADGQRLQDVDVAARQPGQAEQAEPRRQVGELRLLA